MTGEKGPLCETGRLCDLSITAQYLFSVVVGFHAIPDVALPLSAWRLLWPWMEQAEAFLMETENLHVVSLGDLGAYGELALFFFVYDEASLISSLDEEPPLLQEIYEIYHGSMRRELNAV